MKKWIAILISLALMIGCCSAENMEGTGKVTLGNISINGAFTLQCGLPEGYREQPLKMNPEQYMAVIVSEDPEMPVMQLSVAFDETYSDVDRMNDLDDEALALLEKTFTDVDPTVEITYGETGLGTQLLIAHQTDESSNYIDFLSIYKGYFVEFVLVPSQTASSKTLTNDQLRMCIDFLTDLDFIPAGEPVRKPLDTAGKTWLANLSGYDPESKTVTAVLREPIALDPEMVAELKEGDTLKLGETEETIETLEKDEYDEIIINDDITLREADGVFHAYMYDAQYMENIAEITVEIPDTMVFLDGIDPESGEPLEEPAVHTAEEFIAIISADGNEDPGFDLDNTNITFDENGTLAEAERFYTPWQ